MNNKLIENIQQQTKRLLDQLQELEAYKEELEQEEYEELKKSTLEDLKTFQHYLGNLQKGDQILQSEIEKSKKQIIEACKNSIDKESIMGQLMDGQVKGIRAAISQLDKAYQLKKIPENHYFIRRRQLLVDIQQTGATLTGGENQWLQLHHFDEKQEGQISKKVEQKQMGIAEKNIKSME